MTGEDGLKMFCIGQAFAKQGPRSPGTARVGEPRAVA